MRRLEQRTDVDRREMAALALLEHAPKPPKQASKAAREVLQILDQIKPGDMAKVTVEEGQSVHGLKVSFERVASNHGGKIQIWSVPDESDVLYIKPA